MVVALVPNLGMTFRTRPCVKQQQHVHSFKLLHLEYHYFQDVEDLCTSLAEVISLDDTSSCYVLQLLVPVSMLQ